MVRKKDEFNSLRRIADWRATVAVQILEGAYRAREEMGHSFSLGFRK